VVGILLPPPEEFGLLHGRRVIREQFVAMILKPLGKPPPLFQGQRLNLLFQVFHAHAGNLAAPSGLTS